MQRHGRADSSEKVYLTGIAELFFGCGGRGWLDKLSKPGTGVGEAPGR
jgi:hypothetical protein